MERFVVLYDSGRWCEVRRADLKAAARARATEEQIAKATYHLTHCDRCRMEFQRLALRLIPPAGALIPLPVLMGPRPVDRAAAALDTVRGWWESLRCRAGESVHQLAGSVTASGDSAERVITAGKGAIAAICVTAAAGAGVCTLAGVHISGSGDKQRPHHQRQRQSQPVTEAPPAAVERAAAVVRTPAKRRRQSSRSTASLDPAASRAPAPAPPGGTEFGPDTGGTNAAVPPAPADPQAGAIGP
jgi:hypothetical protein